MTYERLRLNDGCTDQYVLYCYTPEHNVAQFPARCFDDPSLIISNKEDENDGAEDKSGQRQDVENDDPGFVPLYVLRSDIYANVEVSRVRPLFSWATFTFAGVQNSDFVLITGSTTRFEIRILKSFFITDLFRLFANFIKIFVGSSCMILIKV